MTSLKEIGVEVGSYLKDIPFEKYCLVLDNGRVNVNNLKITSRLGNGFYSTGYACFDIKTGKEYALKITQLDTLYDGDGIFVLKDPDSAHDFIKWGKAIMLANSHPDIFSTIHKAWSGDFNGITYVFLLTKLYQDTVFYILKTPNDRRYPDSVKDIVFELLIKNVIKMYDLGITGDIHTGNWMYIYDVESDTHIVRLVDIDMSFIPETREIKNEFLVSLVNHGIDFEIVRDFAYLCKSRASLKDDSILESWCEDIIQIDF